jgi:hypothetical protein
MRIFSSTWQATWLIVLDTFHQPYSVPFDEREFMGGLTNLKDPFKIHGVLLLDDIQLDEEINGMLVGGIARQCHGVGFCSLRID